MSETKKETLDDVKTVQFHEMGLDDRLLKAIAKLGWEEPTAIQERVIPLMLDRKDVLIRARTGSGKTGAFAIPVIQKILNAKQKKNYVEGIRSLILAPTKELSQQIHQHICSLSVKCSRYVRSMDITSQVEFGKKCPLLNDPDIVIGTPALTLSRLKNGDVRLGEAFETLIVDEADLVFSFGYEDEVKGVLSFMPPFYQAALASATLSEDVVALKKIALRNAVILKLEEPGLAPLKQLSHYYLDAQEEDKAVVLYTLLKLKLVSGKTIVFVNTVDRCYKLKLFLEQFHIPTCVLNAELPAASRCHAVSQFNADVYNIIIASDEIFLGSDIPHKNQNSTKRKRDNESGVARGIDFQRVSNVINFDFTYDVDSYIHRAGRTARGRNKGMVLSLVNVREKGLMEEVDEYIKSNVLDDVDAVFEKFKFDMGEAAGFRYRTKDAWRAVTRIAVREARLKEIKHEIMNSKKLKTYFQENPSDLKTLRHDKALHTVKLQDHLADVPDYIIPTSLKKILPDCLSSRGKATVDASSSRQTLGVKFKKGKSKAFRKYVSNKENPLMSMEFSGFGEK